MALTASNPFSVDKTAPDFKLLNVVSKEINSLNQLKGNKGTLVLFICNHCPYVIHINEFLVSLTNNYQKKELIL